MKSNCQRHHGEKKRRERDKRGARGGMSLLVPTCHWPTPVPKETGGEYRGIGGKKERMGKKGGEML